MEDVIVDNGIIYALGSNYKLYFLSTNFYTDVTSKFRGYTCNFYVNNFDYEAEPIPTTPPPTTSPNESDGFTFNIPGLTFIISTGSIFFIDLIIVIFL